jgi:hypothetical protein
MAGYTNAGLELTSWFKWRIPQVNPSCVALYGIPYVNHEVNSNPALMQPALNETRLQICQKLFAKSIFIVTVSITRRYHVFCCDNADEQAVDSYCAPIERLNVSVPPAAGSAWIELPQSPPSPGEY